MMPCAAPPGRPGLSLPSLSVRIDLNADLGEGLGTWRLGDDEALLDVITSANVACGFHAGDPVTMRRVCEQAVARGVTIGAQVGYRDLHGFGRRRIEMPPDELTADVLYQLGALEACARAAGDRVRYVKPHGALYNSAAVEQVPAAAVVEAVAIYDPTLPLLGLPGSVLQREAERAGLPFVGEAFADRRYRADGTLVSRTEDGAVLTDADSVIAQALSLARDGVVVAVDGTRVPVTAATVCVHGDTPGAVALAVAVRAALAAAGVVVAPFLR